MKNCLNCEKELKENKSSFCDSCEKKLTFREKEYILLNKFKEDSRKINNEFEEALSLSNMWR